MAVCFSQWMKCWLSRASPLLRGHLGMDDLLCASEADADEYESHIWDSEVAIGAFPQAELDGAIVAEVVETGSDGVPVECGIFRVVSEYFGDISAKVEEEVHDCVAGCGFDFLHWWEGC